MYACFPQKYGQPDSRPVPSYIRRLISHRVADKKAKGEKTLFSEDYAEEGAETEDSLIPDVEISESEYRSNPLAADVKYWGQWVLDGVLRQIDGCYATGQVGRPPVAFLWARTVTCENPTCRATIPLLRQLWLSNKQGRRIALRMELDRRSKTVSFSVQDHGTFSFDPAQGTAMKGKVRCPFCNHVSGGKYLKAESKAGRLGQQMMAVVETRPDGKGKVYRATEASDLSAYEEASRRLKRKTSQWPGTLSLLPDEPISKQQPRVLFVQLYGLTTWGSLFNARQALALVTFGELILQASKELESSNEEDSGYTRAVVSVLGICLSSISHYLCTSATWLSEGLISSFILGGNIPMKWDYAEGNPIGHLVGT